MNNYRKLLVLATNHLLDIRLISLDPEGKEDGIVFANLAGENSVINWAHVSHGELRISVWWKYNRLLHAGASPITGRREVFQCELPCINKVDYSGFLGAAASGWLERRMGKFLHGWEGRGIVCTYCRDSECAALHSWPDPVPTGYKAEGKFFGERVSHL